LDVRQQTASVDAASETSLPHRPRLRFDSLGRAIESLNEERVAWAVLGVAIALSAALILWLTRGTSFFWDEITYFVASRGFDVKALWSPHAGHLIAGVRFLYATVFKLFGADYVVIRILQVLGVALVAVLFFVLAKRRVGPGVALAPTVLLLFLGPVADITLVPIGITHTYALAAGLGALLALERDDNRGDLAGCALLVLSVCTFSLGLAFVAGGATSVLLGRNRWRRAWIFLVPLAVYGAWDLAAPKLTGPAYNAETHFKLSNVRFVPKFVAQGTAAVAAAATGLSYDFTHPVHSPAEAAPDITTFSRGYPIAVLAALGLLLRLRHGPVRRSLWVSLAVYVAFWGSIAMTQRFNRYPWSERFAYIGAVLLLLVMVDALAGIRLPRRLAPVLVAVTVFALAVNIAQFRGPSDVFRSFSQTSRADLTAVELARHRIDPLFLPPNQVGLAYIAVGGTGPLLEAVDRNGSFAFSLPELRSQPEEVREQADSTLVKAFRLGLTNVPSTPAGKRCRRLRGNLDVPRRLTLRPPGVLLRSSSPEKVTLGRFADTATVEVGSLAPGKSAVLRLPRDRAPEPWHAALSDTRALTVCPLATG
jgi:hypothetical protein